MATSTGEHPRQVVPVEPSNGTPNGTNRQDDPFATEPPSSRPQPHRYSSFDTQLFALNHPSSSPAQAKRALEAHMAETDRRIQETSKLGTTLVQQRVNLAQRLRDVGSQEEEAQISPELRQKLVEIEREYNEVGRQSARAFLGPKSEAAGEGSNAPFALDGRASPTSYRQATDSPSKLNVPRRQRNQASRTDDIDFAAEISTSLLGQVRHLQAVLLERDETLKVVQSDKSSLELEAEGFAQRLRSLDESEQRYKDENWNLETQLQETNAANRESVGREQKLQQILAAATSEKNTAQSELDHLRQDHSRMTEDYTAVRKTHESELASLRKSVNFGVIENETQQRKIEELTSQNRELANGLAGRFRDEETEREADTGAKFEEYPFDLSEREHSPPPSPTKGVQRHSMLESETLKSSLNHAHRMIQNLKGNVHREKAEKQDLKRMLQEARDELEIRRAEPNGKRLKAKSHTDMRRAGRPGLGATRNSRTDVMVDDAEHDPEWEDHKDEDSPRRDVGARSITHDSIPRVSRLAESSEAYQTANETEDAFETANERDTTDNDAFQTGAESMAGDTTDEAEATETESGVARGGTIRSKRPQPAIFTKAGDRRSIQSTASTSEDDEGHALHTPSQNQPQRYRPKVNRNSRRSRVSSEVPGSSQLSSARNSPASFTNGGGEVNQSLFTELENLSGDENGTPSKGIISSPRSTQSLRRSVSGKRSSSSMRTGVSPSTSGPRPSTVVYTGGAPPIPKRPMVDSSMMTEPMGPLQSSPNQAGAAHASLGKASLGQASPSPQSLDVLSMSSTAAITSRIFGSTPETPQNKGVESQSASASNFGSDSRSSSSSRRPAWDQPLQMFGKIPGFDQSADTTPLSTRSTTTQVRGVSGDLSSDDQRARNFSSNSTQPTEYSESMHDDQGVTPPGTAIKARAPLTLSPIHSLESAPVQPIQRSMTNELSGTTAFAGPPTAAATSDTTEIPPKTTSTGGILGSVFGWNKRKASTGSQIAEDETRQEAATSSRPTTSDSKRPLQEVPANAVTRNMQKGNAKLSPVVDRGVQTLSFSDLLESVAKKPSAPSMRPLADIGAASPSLSEAGKGKAPEQYYKDSLGKSFKRPVSATSMRSRAQYPPLPPDHQEAIAAAAQKGPPESLVTPTGSTASMGPPLAPASAYPSRAGRSRSSRPQTPSQQSMPSQSSRGGTTPRAGRYSATRSQASRRSSFSSFASELDERFNIRTNAGMPMPQGLQAGTDPRMIQAITQTMIGEMMWKYTRKAGRGEMSSTRHRRFFWVHPYTRTLYWSDRDPASANRAELKSKSVAIEAVRVVTDDNPMPPGLHRKSLIIITPGRSVKFTAQTSQRHETWFNALSYLLLRTGPDGANTANNPGDLSDADVAEFNPGSNKHSSRSRVSLASFRSSATQNRQDHNRLSTRIPTGATSGGNTQTEGQQTEPPPNKESVRSRIGRSLSRNRGTRSRRESIGPNNATTVYNAPDNQGSVSSRISSYWHKPAASVRSSIRSRSSLREDGPPEPGVLEGGRSVVGGRKGDSAEDLRRVIENQEQGGRLENVRACCDGAFRIFPRNDES
ncbi:MAG: hypothetical protein ASARMPREDX12_007543 [Alectoria sarmentosa]|nr:MAG: hypothetical protein ASARMPREDX12_007543 [Alectoria sarmentosa]